MGFRLIPIGGAGTHEGLQLRGTHKVAVSGNLCVLLNSCEDPHQPGTRLRGHKGRCGPKGTERMEHAARGAGGRDGDVGARAGSAERAQAGRRGRGWCEQTVQE